MSAEERGYPNWQGTRRTWSSNHPQTKIKRAQNATSLNERYNCSLKSELQSSFCIINLFNKMYSARSLLTITDLMLAASIPWIFDKGPWHQMKKKCLAKLSTKHIQLSRQWQSTPYSYKLKRSRVETFLFLEHAGFLM